MSFRLNKVTTATGIGLFVVSLTQKCFCTTSSCGDSIAVLFSGTIGFVLGGAALTWLANPLLIVSWFTINKAPKLSLMCSSLATLVALSFLFFKRIISDEAGNYSDILSYQLGYWLWVLSSFIMFVGNALLFDRGRKRPTLVYKELLNYNTLKIHPNETKIVGHWIFDGSRMIANEECKRIDWLRNNYLIYLTTDESGWLNLYQDPQDKRYWQLDWEHGPMQGGGPPSLILLLESEAKEKYNI